MFSFLKSKLSYPEFGNLITNYVSDTVFTDAGVALGRAFEDGDGSEGWRKFLIDRGVDQNQLAAFYRTFLHAALQCSSKLLPENERFPFMQGSNDTFNKAPPGYDFEELCEALESELEHSNLDEMNPFISHDFRINGLPNPWSAYIAGEVVYERSAAQILARFNMRPGSSILTSSMASAIAATMRAGAQITKQHKLV